VKPPSGAQDQIFVTVKQLSICWCGVTSLTGEQICRLQLLLIIVSAVILGSEFCGTHAHMLLSQIPHSPKLEGQVHVFISQRNRVPQLYLQALGIHFVAYYYSHG
jgi:hypothetical protein